MLGELGLVGLAASQYHSNMSEWLHMCVCVCWGIHVCAFVFVCVLEATGFSSKNPSVYKETVYKEHLEY